MACSNELVMPPCSYVGKGFLDKPLAQGEVEVSLITNNGLNFYNPPAGKYYYAMLSTPCGNCCETVRVLAVTKDKVAIDRITTTNCCFSATSTLSVISINIAMITDIVKSNRPNYASPLHYDCNTDTVSMDCSAFAVLTDQGCSK